MNNLAIVLRKYLALFAFAVLMPSLALAQFEPTRKLSSNSIAPSTNESMASCMAVTGDTLHIVWSDQRTKGSAIYYTRSVDTGSHWTQHVPLTDTNSKATFPTVAVVGQTVHVAWMDESLGHRASYYRRSLDGGVNWQPIIALDSTSAFWPGLAADGNLVVVSINKTVTTGNSEVFIRRSLDGGATWDPLWQISNAPNRSEDPAVAVSGNHVYLSWNDKRSGTMLTYYRHSSDRGATWGSETPLTTSNSYTTMTSASGANVDVVYGLNNGTVFNSYIRQSTDYGETFAPAVELSTSIGGGLYPYLVRDGENLHVAYLALGATGGTYYTNSSNGGAEWSEPQFISHSSQPFIAASGCAVHLLWADSGSVYYARNSFGNGPCLHIIKFAAGPLHYFPEGQFLSDTVSLGKTLSKHQIVMNQNEWPCTIKDIYLAGLNSSDYSLGGVTFPLVLKPGDTVGFELTSKPGALGMREAELIISANSPDTTLKISQQVIGTEGQSSVSASTTVDGIRLGQIFPNPSTNSTTITFKTEHTADVRVMLMDMAGRIIRVIANGKFSAGEHSISLDASELPSGTYAVALESGSTRLVREMVVRK